MLKSPILGIDFGQSRIGLAISDDLGFMAHPLETVPAGKGVLKRIAQIVNERKIDQVVVGLPRNMDGSLGPAAEGARKFVEELGKAVSCRITTWDERLTTVAAHRSLREAGKKTKTTKGYVDQVAAQMILQGYLDRSEEMARVAKLKQ